ncbi:hypothetical protein CFP56_014092 [Quercus suber]|uniref:Uncharacterized protein n=1 Tax=Quercus suber TaxID=58331 RepID=A0AAW0KUI2_QUESU
MKRTVIWTDSLGVRSGNESESSVNEYTCDGGRLAGGNEDEEQEVINFIRKSDVDVRVWDQTEPMKVSQVYSTGLWGSYH